MQSNLFRSTRNPLGYLTPILGSSIISTAEMRALRQLHQKQFAINQLVSVQRLTRIHAPATQNQHPYSRAQQIRKLGAFRRTIEVKQDMEEILVFKERNGEKNNQKIHTKTNSLLESFSASRTDTQKDAFFNLTQSTPGLSKQNKQSKNNNRHLKKYHIKSKYSRSQESPGQECWLAIDSESRHPLEQQDFAATRIPRKNSHGRLGRKQRKSGPKTICALAPGQKEKVFPSRADQSKSSIFKCQSLGQTKSRLIDTSLKCSRVSVQQVQKQNQRSVFARAHVLYSRRQRQSREVLETDQMIKSFQASQQEQEKLMQESQQSYEEQMP